MWMTTTWGAEIGHNISLLTNRDPREKGEASLPKLSKERVPGTFQPMVKTKMLQPQKPIK